MVALQQTTVFQEEELCVRHEIIIGNPHKKSRTTLAYTLKNFLLPNYTANLIYRKPNFPCSRLTNRE
jgi:hypothetical protein